MTDRKIAIEFSSEQIPILCFILGSIIEYCKMSKKDIRSVNELYSMAKDSRIVTTSEESWDAVIRHRHKFSGNDLVSIIDFIENHLTE